MSQENLPKYQLAPKHLVINKQTSEFEILTEIDESQYGDEWIVTQINRHTYVFDEGAELLTQLILKQGNYDEIMVDEPQLHFGLCLDLLFYVDVESYNKVNPNHQEIFLNIHRRKQTPIVDVMVAYKEYAQ